MREARVQILENKFHALLKPPSNFIAGRPKAALLLCFRCGVPLFIVILAIY